MPAAGGEAALGTAAAGAGAAATAGCCWGAGWAGGGAGADEAMLAHDILGLAPPSVGAAAAGQGSRRYNVTDRTTSASWLGSQAPIQGRRQAPSDAFRRSHATRTRAIGDGCGWLILV